MLIYANEQFFLALLLHWTSLRVSIKQKEQIWYLNMESIEEKTLPVNQVSWTHTQLWYLVLCNPKFVSKNNRHFNLSSLYFLYPLTSLPIMVKPQMPASIEQS